MAAPCGGKCHPNAWTESDRKSHPVKMAAYIVTDEMRPLKLAAIVLLRSNDGLKNELYDSRSYENGTRDRLEIN